MRSSYLSAEMSHIISKTQMNETLGKGVTKKGHEAIMIPRRYPTSFWIGGGGSNPVADHAQFRRVYDHLKEEKVLLEILRRCLGP